MITVLIAEDQPSVREGLAMLVDTASDLRVIGQAADGTEAVRLARQLRPDVVLMDIRMPGLDGLGATRQLAGPEQSTPLAVVIVTTFDLDEYVHEALRSGARGFLLKDAGPVLIGEAIRAAAAGDALISPRITTRLLETFARPSRRRPAQHLTSREEEVLHLVATGMTNTEIGAELHLSLGTVKTHIGGVLTKLGLRNRVEAAMWAYETGRVQR
ncbi:response regulator transcription factor [Nesterenkonia lutea]|uniref:DNA-binding NarL/FixJ family response regulator n=1 Tax=Nesterenkonia lutea TaxID=272919 RepID=A0ABR9JDJ9_9MICC|nr:response regulator transcription factor [Nesterenkonia lutea]MBE1524004.1 DNA-binding NarL/FixJ family response regulator [Nesterenkonia lutea]